MIIEKESYVCVFIPGTMSKGQSKEEEEARKKIHENGKNINNFDIMIIMVMMMMSTMPTMMMMELWCS